VIVRRSDFFDLRRDFAFTEYHHSGEDITNLVNLGCHVKPMKFIALR